MNLSKAILFCFLFCFSLPLFAQIQRDFSTSVIEFRFDNLGQQLQFEGIDYNKIDGSPFWADSLQPASFYDSKGYITTLPARINLASNKIYFLQNGVEMILKDNIITRIVFQTGNDSAVFIGQVPNLLLNNKPLTSLVQVLNFGKYQLLKYTRKKISSSETPSRISKTYYYIDEVIYFIMSNEKIEGIKKLNKESILIYLPSSSSYNVWLKENDINFRNEKDIVRFLNYYNAGLSK